MRILLARVCLSCKKRFCFIYISGDKFSLIIFLPTLQVSHRIHIGNELCLADAETEMNKITIERNPAVKFKDQQVVDSHDSLTGSRATLADAAGEDRVRSFKALIQPWQKKVAPSPVEGRNSATSPPVVSPLNSQAATSPVAGSPMLGSSPPNGVIDNAQSFISTGDTSRRESSAGPRSSVSRATVERSVAAKIYFEQYFDRLYKSGPTARAKRRLQLEAELAKMTLTEGEKRGVRQEWLLKESERMRRMREKITVTDFESLKTIGHGAFGVVKLVRQKSTGEVYAMKILKKSEALKRNQESHVRAERDLLSEAAECANWVVKLVYSFQDDEFLYFVMEYMPGGDLLSLLIKLDIFDEDFAKHYAAEMILAIEEVHKLG